MMIRAVLACSSLVVLTGCSSLNPFADSGPKMAPLPVLTVKSDVRVQWETRVGKSDDYVFTPAVVDRAVYVAGARGVIQKLESGKLVWQVEAGQPLSAGVGASATTVVVGTPKGEVLAFSALDGRALWKARVSSEVLAPPAVGAEGVAVRAGDNSIFLLDLNDGSRKWVYQRAMPALSVRSAGAPVFADRYVFTGFPGGRLVALALSNGAPVWEGTVALPKGTTELDRIADIAASPAVDGPQICAVAFQGRVACFDMVQGGGMLWSRDISSVSGVTLEGRHLFLTDDSGTVHALDRNTGGTLWRQDALKLRGVSAPAVARGHVVVGDVEGYLHFLTREEGAFAARHRVDGAAIRSRPLVAGRAFLVQSAGGDVQAVEVQ